MKNNYLAILIASLFVLFSCEKEQSQLDMDMLKERAIIEGYIVYNAGVDTLSTTDFLTDRMLPVVKQKVFVEIDYSDIKPTSSGNYIVEAVTDEKGHYSIEVPTTTTGVPAVVRMQEFSTYMSICEGVTDGKPVFKTDLYSYSFEKNIANLSPRGIRFMEDSEVVCTHTQVSLDSLNFEDNITVQGQINLAEETAFRTGIYKNANNARVQFTVKYSEPSIAANTYKFNTTTDAQGNYTITLPIESYEKGFASLAVEVQGTGANYKHFTAPGKSVNLPGAYVSTNVMPGTAIGNIIEGMKYPMPTMYLRFTPFYNNGLPTNTPLPNSWENNLVGWERYDGFTQTATISGKYLMATESSFAVGKFTNESQEAKIAITYPGSDVRGGAKTVIVPTNVDGTFSFKVPVVDENEVPTDLITFAYVKPNNTTLKHYIPSNKTIALVGEYPDDMAHKFLIEEPLDPASEMGVVYYKFKVTGSPAPEVMWNENLAGWNEAKAMKNKYAATAEVAANVYMAEETGFGVGNYVPGNGMHAVVTADSEEYIFPVINGKVKGTIFIQNSTSEPALKIKVTKAIDEFEHYDIDGVKRLIKGEFASSETDKAYWTGLNKADRTVWSNLGNIYCSFAPTSPDADWTNYFKYIAGWQRRADAPITKNVEGTIHKAVESAYYSGTYVPVDKQLVKITVGAVNYVGPTNVSGKYSIPAHVKESETNPGVTVVPYFTANNVEYVSYINATQTKKLKVKYTYAFESERIDGYVDWNVRANTYYKVGAVDGGVLPPNLIGWANYQNRIANKANQTIYLKGAMLKAAIKSDGLSGEWLPNAKSYPAEIIINNVHYFTIVSGSEFNIPFNVTEVPSSIKVGINVDGGSADEKRDILNYYYVDPITSSVQPPKQVYGYYTAGTIAEATVNRDGDLNDFYLSDKSTISDNTITNKKVTLRFKVTYPDNISTFTNWGTYSPTYLYK